MNRSRISITRPIYRFCTERNFCNCRYFYSDSRRVLMKAVEEGSSSQKDVSFQKLDKNHVNKLDLSKDTDESRSIRLQSNGDSDNKLSNSIQEKVGHFMQMYEEFVGLTEVKYAQDKVVKVCLFVCPEIRIYRVWFKCYIFHVFHCLVWF